MGKKFMGLDGTDHFWDRAKAWILNQITSAGMDKQSVIDAVYPVGSLYWSSKDTDPSTLFGGTWVQIKDRFVLACGDTYNTTGATGGASTVTLSVSNMPSHNHSFTPSGTVSSHSHGLNGHTHSFTPSGSVSSTFTGTKGTVNVSGGNHRHSVSTQALTGGDNTFSYYASRANPVTRYTDYSGNLSLSGSFTPSGSVSSTFTGNAGTTGGASGNTASATPTFSGSAGTTGSSGSGTAFSILPPYIVKYCWERTA